MVIFSFDLLVLREIIQNMSGIESTTGLTNDQIEALAGGETLRQEVCLPSHYSILMIVNITFH